MPKLYIIPEPKNVKLHNEAFSLPKKSVIHAGHEVVFEAGFLASEIRRLNGTDLKIVQLKNLDSSIFISEERSLGKNSGIAADLPLEAYNLTVKKNSVAICGNSEAGVWNGIQSFLQLLENHSPVRTCEITDWPDMPVRGIHLDLKGGMCKFSYLKECLRTFSRYKINTVLLEYEDKFPYKKHAGISSPQSLSAAQCRALEKIAASYHIQIVPLVQCLGHVEYILRKNDYRHIAENEEIQQYCPLKPEAFELFKEMASEVMAINRTSPYFHIGGDEARNLGSCPACSAKAKKDGRSKLFTDYIKKICSFIIEKGKIPVMWDDMITGADSPEILKELPSETILMYWQYTHTGKEVPTINWHGPRFSKKWHKKQNHLHEEILHEQLPPYYAGYIEDMPEHVLKLYRPYIKSARYPVTLKTFPYLGFLKDRGYQVLGASCIRTSKEPDYLFPDFIRSASNVRMWGKEISSKKGLGVISTAWARSATFNKPCAPFELCWYSVLASGEFYWSGARPVSMDTYDKKFCRIFYGLENTDILDAMYIINTANHESYIKLALDKIKELEASVTRNIRSIRFIKIAAELLIYRYWREAVFERCIRYRYHRIIKNDLTDFEKKQFCSYLRNFLPEREKVIHDAARLYASLMPAEEVAEYLDDETGPDEIIAKEYLKILEEK